MRTLIFRTIAPGLTSLMLLFSVFMSISLFQREMTSGSISMVLSKPIARTTFLIGKYLGQVAVQLSLCTLMGLITIVVTERYGDPAAAVSILQSTLLVSGELAILVEGDRRLFNQYGVMLVNPAKHPHVKKDLAMQFIDWITSPDGQAAIAEYRIGRHQLFFPNAGKR